MILLAFFSGFFLYAAYRALATGFYTVRPDERAVLTSFGRAQRLPGASSGDQRLSEEEQQRYEYPGVHVIQPGGAY